MECESYRDQMLDVLYGEADSESARRVEEHQSSCEACRDEMAALRHVRRDLRAWTLPAEPVTLRPQPAAFRPQWALATAAGLLMAAGAALGFSGSELRYQNGQLAFRLGRAAASTDVAALLAAQEARFRQEIQALKSQGIVPASAAPLPAASRLNEAAFDAAVRRVVRESEVRQVAILNSSLSDLEDRLADQRRSDLERVGTGLAMVDTRSTINAARYTELVARAFPVSEQK
jgi:hypothetical protein